MSPAPVALTAGDPAGIGPELCCRVAAGDGDLAVIGSRALFARVAAACDLEEPGRVIEVPVDLDPDAVEPGRSDAACGAAAVAWVERAIAGCRAGEFAAMVTAPLCKASALAAGADFPGHTELCARRCGLGDDDVTMCLHGAAASVALVSVHLRLAEVPAAITAARLRRTVRHHAGFLARLHGRAPRLACCGLNPHAGEDGRFGDEEIRVLIPALEELRAEGIAVDGPLPADTAFAPGIRDAYDGHVCCYHDQGLAPFKALCFDDGVNLTLGLPIVRTSPDHGTAFDRAWRGTASAASMHAAVQLARTLAPSPAERR